MNLNITLFDRYLYSDFDINKIYYMIRLESNTVNKVKLKSVQILNCNNLLLQFIDCNTGELFNVNKSDKWTFNINNEKVTFKTDGKDKLYMYMCDYNSFESNRLKFCGSDFKNLVIDETKSIYLQSYGNDCFLICYRITESYEIEPVDIPWRILWDNKGLKFLIDSNYNIKNGFYPTKEMANKVMMKLLKNKVTLSNNIKDIGFFNYWNSNCSFTGLDINWELYDPNKSYKDNAINIIKNS